MRKKAKNKIEQKGNSKFSHFVTFFIAMSIIKRTEKIATFITSPKFKTLAFEKYSIE